MNFKADDHVPVHCHPNEQCGFVVSYEYNLTIGNETVILEAGDSYIVSPKHIILWMY